MKKMIKYKFLYAIITIAIFMSLYFISKTYLSELYLFEWTARHNYINLWIVAIGLIFCNKIKISFSVTIGNFVGVLIGQFAGDWIRNCNMLKITADMDAGVRYQLQHHPGVELWLLTIVVFVVGTILLNSITKRRLKGLQNSDTNIPVK